MKVLILFGALLLSSTSFADTWDYYDSYAKKKIKLYNQKTEDLRNGKLSETEKAREAKEDAEEAHADLLKRKKAADAEIAKQKAVLEKARKEKEKLKQTYLKLNTDVAPLRTKYDELAGLDDDKAAIKKAREAYISAKKKADKAADAYRDYKGDIEDVQDDVESAQKKLTTIRDGSTFGPDAESKIQADLKKAREKYKAAAAALKEDQDKADLRETKDELLKFQDETARGAAKAVFDDAGKTILEGELILTDLDVLKERFKSDVNRLHYLQGEAAHRLDNTMLGKYVMDKIKAAGVGKETAPIDVCGQMVACEENKKVNASIRKLEEFVNKAAADSGEGKKTNPEE